jgi:hypothetical protein
MTSSFRRNDKIARRNARAHAADYLRYPSISVYRASVVPAAVTWLLLNSTHVHTPHGRRIGLKTHNVSAVDSAWHDTTLPHDAALFKLDWSGLPRCRGSREYEPSDLSIFDRPIPQEVDLYR